MAHGDQIRRFLRTHDPGYLRDGQDIALGNLTLLNLFKGFWKKKNSGLCSRSPFGCMLGRNIDHPSSSRLVEMGEFCHFVKLNQCVASIMQLDYRSRRKGRSSSEAEPGVMQLMPVRISHSR